MTPTSQFTVTDTGPDRRDIQKLGNVVNDAIVSISDSSGLSPSETLVLLEKVHVEFVSQLKDTVEALEDSGELRRVDPVKLSKAIEESIAAICNATALDTYEITKIFTEEPGASVDSIVHRMRARSSSDRFWHS
jgi:hypothetical protein